MNASSLVPDDLFDALTLGPHRFHPLGGVNEGKISLLAKVTPDLVSQGFHAGNLVREVAKMTGGGGGGRADFAQAGGRNPEKLQEALDAVPGLVAAQKA